MLIYKHYFVNWVPTRHSWGLKNKRRRGKVFKTRFFQLTINKRHAMRRKKAGKIHENIWKDHKMLPIFTTTILFHHVLEREKLFIRNWTIDILLYIASSCMQAQNKFTQNNEKKFPLHHSQMEFGTWHIFLYICHRRGEWGGGGKCHSSSKTNDERTWSEMVIMRSQISEFYAFLFTSCFTCHVEFPSLCRLPVGGFINKIKSLNFMETLDFLDYNHQHQQTRNFHARTKN